MSKDTMKKEAPSY